MSEVIMRNKVEENFLKVKNITYMLLNKTGFGYPIPVMVKFCCGKETFTHTQCNAHVLRVQHSSLFRRRCPSSLKAALTPCGDTSWGLAGGQLCRTGPRCRWPESCPWASSTPWQQRRAAASWAAGTEARPGDHYPHLLSAHYSASAITGASLGPPSRKRASVNQSTPSGGHQGGQGLQHLPCEERLVSWLCPAWRNKGCRAKRQPGGPCRPLGRWSQAAHTGRRMGYKGCNNSCCR